MKKINLFVACFFWLLFAAPGVYAGEAVTLGEGNFIHLDQENKSRIEVTIKSVNPFEFTADWQLYFQFIPETTPRSYFHLPLVLEIHGKLDSDGGLSENTWKINDLNGSFYNQTENLVTSLPSIYSFEESVDTVCVFRKLICLFRYPESLQNYPGENINIILQSDILGDLELEMKWVKATYLPDDETNYVITYELDTEPGDNCDGGPCGVLRGDSDYIWPNMYATEAYKRDVYHPLGIPYTYSPETMAEIFEVRTRYGAAWTPGVSLEARDIPEETFYNTIGNYDFTYTAVGSDAAGNSVSPESADILWTVHVLDVPMVLSTEPKADTDEFIDFSADISATFNKEMAGNTVEEAFSMVAVNPDLSEDTVIGTPMYDPVAKTLFFNPDTNLDFNTKYQVSISNTAMSLEGDRLPYDEAYIWTFTTPHQPYVKTVSPASGAINIASDTTIKAFFSTNMDIDTVTEAIIVKNTDTNSTVNGDVSLSTDQVVFTPETALSPGTIYTVSINSNAKDSLGYPLKEMSWMFTTATASVPSPNTSGSSDEKSGGCFIYNLF